tara:strand:- start:69 stop:338 length:270 start_codon:yes stop_codon:yes gene_type:complete
MGTIPQRIGPPPIDAWLRKTFSLNSILCIRFKATIRNENDSLLRQGDFFRMESLGNIPQGQQAPQTYETKRAFFGKIKKFQDGLFSGLV